MPRGENSFKKGKEKTGGRKEGSINKKTAQWEAFTEYCLNGGLEKFELELQLLKGEKFVNAFLALLEFHKPKLARTTLEGDADKPLYISPNIIIKPKDVGND